MLVVPWGGPPPFGGRATVVFGTRRTAATKPAKTTTVGCDGWSERINLIERWNSHEVILENVPDPLS